MPAMESRVSGYMKSDLDKATSVMFCRFYQFSMFISFHAIFALLPFCMDHNLTTQ